MTDVDMRNVTPATMMTGEDDEETALLRSALREGAAFLESFEWCRGIKESYFGLGIGGVVAVFLFRIDAPPSVDEWLWIIVGDMPSCYLVTDGAPTPLAALEIYCDTMEDWAAAVRGGQPLDDVFPVKAAPTDRNAAALDSRMAFVRKNIIPMFR
jgi:hypothetical protein